NREAAAQAVRKLFEKDIVQKVTIVKIPHKRDYMHIDTVFTQVKKNVWVMLGDFSSERISGLQTDELHRALRIQPHHIDDLEILQFEKGSLSEPKRFHSLEDLLVDISVTDLGCAPASVRIILSGNDEFPY